MHEKIREGFDVFLHDGGKSFGAVRQVRKNAILDLCGECGRFRDSVQARFGTLEAGKVIFDATHLHLN